MSAAVESHRRPQVIEGHDISLLGADDVVVVLLWHLGDVLNCTAFFPELATRHPGRLVLATTRACLPLVQHNPYLSKIFVIGVPIPAVLTFEDFDRVRDLARTYFARNTVHNLHFPISLPSLPTHYLERWREALGLDGSLSALRPSYFPSRPEAVRRENVFVLGNGGSSPIKRWPMTHWQALTGRLKQRFPALRLVQMGSTADAPIEGVEDLRGQTSIEQGYHVLKAAVGCVSNDSFLAHFAAAAGCPTYVMYGHSSPRNFRPLGSGEVVSLGGRLPCSPCYRSRCLWSLGLHRCLAFPSVRRVFDAVAHRIDDSPTKEDAAAWA